MAHSTICIKSKNGPKICDAKVCDNILTQMRGLMFSPRRNLLFVFSWKNSIRLHMVGVLYSIEVIGLDEKKKVVCTKKLEPLQFWKSPEPVKYIIELSKKPYKLPKKGAVLEF